MVGDLARQQPGGPAPQRAHAVALDRAAGHLAPQAQRFGARRIRAARAAADDLQQLPDPAQGLLQPLQQVGQRDRGAHPQAAPAVTRQRGERLVQQHPRMGAVVVFGKAAVEPCAVGGDEGGHLALQRGERRLPPQHLRVQAHQLVFHFLGGDPDGELVHRLQRLLAPGIAEAGAGQLRPGQAQPLEQREPLRVVDGGDPVPVRLPREQPAQDGRQVRRIGRRRIPGVVGAPPHLRQEAAPRQHAQPRKRGHQVQPGGPVGDAGADARVQLGIDGRLQPRQAAGEGAVRIAAGASAHRLHHHQQQRNRILPAGVVELCAESMRHGAVDWHHARRAVRPLRS